MKGRNLAGDDIRRYQHWEWPQGVGVYGLWKLFARYGALFRASGNLRQLTEVIGNLPPEAQKVRMFC